ncbi:hypothetical protein EIP91_006004 [Steccherinum ochraceum]|uniref:Major facilitator superfamily (MFS) profile domain-containing protein n=1 Tax=Steccherinum ochraceum TaxID=92696 RepID=A0A4R0R6D3_9APHY|nr:hypothetical protein EIP91_006004 [Steccherinum ochraceum]
MALQRSHHPQLEDSCIWHSAEGLCLGYHVKKTSPQEDSSNTTTSRSYRWPQSWPFRSLNDVRNPDSTRAMAEDESNVDAITAITVEDLEKAEINPPQTIIPVEDAPLKGSQRGLKFWLVFVALCSAQLLSALDLGGVGTAAPTIVSNLNGTDFTWVGSAYSLSSAACLPLSGNLAQIFGRRPILLASLILFAAGSAISASAHSMSILIGGRAIQGVGGGGIQSLVAIVTADITSLRDRGLFTGIIGVMWTLGSVIGPFVTGSLAEKASWRWIFYLNLPLCGLAFGAVILLLDLPTPPHDSLWTKIGSVDWIGNALIIASTTSCIIALTWGGVHLPWSSPQVIVPLVVGVLGLAISLLYEFRWATKPTIPKSVFQNRTSSFGLLATFLHGIAVISVGFYLPTWFQSVRAASPIVSGLLFLPMVATISPSAIVQGIIVTKLGKYRLVNVIGWCFMLLGMGLFISMHVETSIGVLVVYQLILGFVLAPLSVTENAAAVSLLTFFRVFSQAWGIAIAGTILQNELSTRLPPAVIAQLPHGAELAYAIVPKIPDMQQPAKAQVEQAFLSSMRKVWIVMEGLCAAGLVTALAAKDVPLHKKTDEEWDMKVKTDGETSAGVAP